MSLPGKRNDKTEHRYVEDRLSAYMDGQLSSRERRVVEGHLAQCQHCQWNLDTLQQTVQWMRELPPVPVPRVFTIPVPAQPAPAPGWRWRVPLLQGATAVVALLLFFVAAGDIMLTAVRPGIQPALAPPAEVAVERAPAALQATEAVEQVEEMAPEPASVAEEPMVAESFDATSAPLHSPEPAQVLEMEAGVADSAVGAAEMEVAAPEAEEIALEAVVEEKAAAAPPTAVATGPAETKAARVEPTPTSPPTATSLPTTATPTSRPTATPLPTITAPTAVAEVLAQPLSPSGEQRSEAVVVSRQPLGSWLGLAEIVLGVALVLLATTTAVAMIQRRRSR